MQAFVQTPVSKEQLLASLHQHQRADSFRKGVYWDPKERRGCAIGCSVMDFSTSGDAIYSASGDVIYSHTRYESLFGIPAQLAMLEDTIFEEMNPADIGRWPLEFIEAIPEGKDLSQDPARWILKILDDERSPIAPHHAMEAMQPVRDLLTQWLKTSTITQETRQRAMDKVSRQWLERDDLAAADALHVAAVAIDYVRKQTQDPPQVASSDRLMMDCLLLHSSSSYAHNNCADPTDEGYKRALDHSYVQMAALLLETLAETAAPA